MSIDYREAKLEDAQQIIDHTLAVFAENPTFYGTRVDEFNVTMEQEKSWIENHQQHGFLYVATLEEQIVGVVNFLPSQSKRFSHQGMLGISIKEAYAGRGIGSTLINMLIDWAREQPTIEKIALEVFSNNERGIHLYKKLGFVEEGRLKRNARLDDGTYVDDIIMAQFV